MNGSEVYRLTATIGCTPSTASAQAFLRQPDRVLATSHSHTQEGSYVFDKVGWSDHLRFQMMPGQRPANRVIQANGLD